MSPADPPLHEEPTSSGHDTFRRRLRETAWAKQWGWSMFGMCMGSGAVMFCVNSVPYHFRGQYTIAVVWLFIDIVLFILCTSMTIIRSIKHRNVFLSSFYDQTEAVWMPVFPVSFAVILIGIVDLGVPHCGEWLIVTLEVLYWFYLVTAALTALLNVNTVRLRARPLEQLTPVDCLEFFPLMLGGTLGSVLCVRVAEHHPTRGLTILLFAMVCQGLGLSLALLKLPSWMLHHYLLPRAPSKALPSYMIAAGPPGFTSLCLVNVGKAARIIFPATDFMSGEGLDPNLVAAVFAIVGNWFALLLNGFFLWFVLIYTGWGVLNAATMVTRRSMGTYSMAWWAWTFPLSGTIATWGQFAVWFPSRAFGILQIIGTIFMVCVWLFNIVGTLNLCYHGILPNVPAEMTLEELKRETNDEPGLFLNFRRL